MSAEQSSAKEYEKVERELLLWEAGNVEARHLSEILGDYQAAVYSRALGEGYKLGWNAGRDHLRVELGVEYP